MSYVYRTNSTKTKTTSDRETWRIGGGTTPDTFPSTRSLSDNELTRNFRLEKTMTSQFVGLGYGPQFVRAGRWTATSTLTDASDCTIPAGILHRGRRTK